MLQPVFLMDSIRDGKEGRIAPVDQPDIVAQALEKALVEMGVRVDQAGDDSPAAAIDHLQVIQAFPRNLPHGRDVPAFDQDICVTLDAVCRAHHVARLLNEDCHRVGLPFHVR